MIGKSLLLVGVSCAAVFLTWFRYGDSARLARQDREDRAAEQAQKDLTWADTQRQAKLHRGRQPDVASIRTFVAEIRHGVADLVQVEDVLRADGRRLNHRDLLMLRLAPEYPLGDSPTPRLMASAGGRLMLWSNGAVTSHATNNLPRFVHDYRTHQPVYSEKFFLQPPGSRYPVGPPVRVDDGAAIAGTIGSNFGLILRADGTVWGEGGNDFGQLGTDAPSFSGLTEPVNGLQGVTAIAAGARHALALTRDGTVWQWGQDDLASDFMSAEFANPYSEPATGSDPKQRQPGFNPTARPVAGLRDVVKIAATGATSLALDRHGAIWVWGGADRCNFIPAPLSTLSLKRPVNYSNAINPIVVGRPYRIPALTDVTDIYAGTNHILALRKDGTVWGWGCNLNRQLGIPETIDFLPDARMCYLDSNIDKKECRADEIINSLNSHVVIDRPHRIRGVDQAKRIFAGPDFSAILKDDDSLWLIGLGCRLCGWNIAQEYSYVLKVRGEAPAARLVEFEALIPPSDLARNTEWGIYWVDDSSGNVGGIAPWDPRYPRVALSPDRALTIYSEVVGPGTKNLLETEAGRLFGMYIVTGGTIEQWRAHEGRDPGPSAYFSFPMANADRLDPTRFNKVSPGQNADRQMAEWFGPNSEKAAHGPKAIAQSVLIRGVRSLRYEELPNHRPDSSEPD